MVLKLGPNNVTIVEEIFWSEPDGVVDFRIMEHTSHTGNVLNKLHKSESGELLLTFEMNWVFKGEGPDPLGTTMDMSKPVLGTAKVIEEAA